MNDPGDLPLEEMSLASPAPTPISPWIDLWTYQKEFHPVFHTIIDYRACILFFDLHRPKVKDILADWTKN
jgi:hypothetical protein